jgi:hypothetical protein
MSIRIWKDTDPYRYLFHGTVIRSFSKLDGGKEVRGFLEGNKIEQAIVDGQYVDGIRSMHRLPKRYRSGK